MFPTSVNGRWPSHISNLGNVSLPAPQDPAHNLLRPRLAGACRSPLRLRVVEDHVHFDTVGKRGKEWWFRISKSLYDELVAIRTASPFVFARLNDEVREFHATEGRKSVAKMVREFSVYNAGRWFYEQVKKVGQ